MKKKRILLRSTLHSIEKPKDSGVTYSLEPTILESMARRCVFNLMKSIENDSLTVIENDLHHHFGTKDAPLAATIIVHDAKFYFDVLIGGDIAFGEAFAHGLISTPDMTDLVRVIVRQQGALKKLSTINIFSGKMIWRAIHRFRKNSIKGAKQNIMAHYDLGNDFFETFLDTTMMYSSGIYSSDTDLLGEASERKLKTICDSLQLKPSDTVLEIGTGWGGFAIYAAQKYGCSITTTTISQEQFHYAKKAVELAGVSDLVTVLDQDYRYLTGLYDKVVSIEMIEAVGHQYLANYLEKINTITKPGGQVLLQAIMLPDQKYDMAKNHADFIKTHIFPGGFLPSLSAILGQTKKCTSLNLVDYLDITQSYAYTLRAWRNRFDEAEQRIDKMGYPEKFRRLWYFYLAYCEGGFTERAIFCAQIRLEKSKIIK